MSHTGSGAQGLRDIPTRRKKRKTQEGFQVCQWSSGKSMKQMVGMYAPNYFFQIKFMTTELVQYAFS